MSAVTEAIDDLVSGRKNSVSLVAEMGCCETCGGEGRVLGSEHGLPPGLRPCFNCGGQGRVLVELRRRE